MSISVLAMRASLLVLLPQNSSTFSYFKMANGSLLPRRDPFLASRGLTLRAVAVTAAVVRNGGTMPAADALIEMTAKCGGTTPHHGQQHLDMPPTDPLAVSLDEGSSSRADEIGNLERRWGHGSTSSPIVTTHLYQNRLAITAPLAHA